MDNYGNSSTYFGTLPVHSGRLTTSKMDDVNMYHMVVVKNKRIKCPPDSYGVHLMIHSFVISCVKSIIGDETSFNLTDISSKISREN